MQMRPIGARLIAPIMAAVVVAAAGCEVDSYFDPSKTGRFEHMPTTIPILERIDVIEDESTMWSQTSDVTAADLEPTTLAYQLSPGDLLTVQIYELYQPTVWHSTASRIDAAGFYRVPEVGDVQAAGMTAQQFEDRLTELLDEEVLPDPLVDVIVEAGTGLRYTLYGAVQAPGMYALQSPDMRLLDALAIAGGVALSTRNVFVIRTVNLSERVEPDYLRGTTPPSPPGQADDPDVDIEQLIEELGSDPAGGSGSGGSSGNDGTPRPAVFRTQDTPPVDVDDLAGRTGQPMRSASPDRADDQTFIFDPQRGEWVPVQGGGGAPSLPAEEPDERPVMTERIIKVPFQRLKRGDNRYNIVVRPGDRIYVQEAEQGVVYLEGEVFRGGVYQLPPSGRLTLSRLIAAAGGLGPLAIPQRVDLTRVVGDNREATVRLNLAAIRQRTQPDVVLKPDDHVIIGTNFWATPLAVVRSGFRATYGFGFLLDRNFGNDVFGAPPSNRLD